MIRFRPFLNGDPPALAELWNRATPERAVVRPLSAHEFDAHVIGRFDFEAAGLIVAEAEGGRMVGFAHAGFGPEVPEGPSHRLDRELGTVAMLVVELGPDGPKIADGLLARAEDYLRCRGAKVIYAGGQSPLNPFYWGMYGGSEFSGILEADNAFRDAAARAGYQAVSTSVLLDADLTLCEPRDPKAAILRRQTRLDVLDDAMPANWWEAMALGEVQISRFDLVAKADGEVLARAMAWEMSAFGRLDGRARTALASVEVEPEHRRKGYGRHLVAEILRHVKGQWGEVVSVQTGAVNLPALGLYLSVGFEPVETSTLCRKPGH